MTELEQGKQELLDLLQQLDEALVGETFGPEELALIERMKEATQGLINVSDAIIRIEKKLENQPSPDPVVLHLAKEWDEALANNDAKGVQEFFGEARRYYGWLKR